MVLWFWGCVLLLRSLELVSLVQIDNGPVSDVTAKLMLQKLFRAFYEPSQQLSDRIFNCIDRAHLIDMGCALNHSEILSDSSPLSSPQTSREQGLFVHT